MSINETHCYHTFQNIYSTFNFKVSDALQLWSDIQGTLVWAADIFYMDTLKSPESV